MSLAILYGNDSDKETETDYNNTADGANLGDVADNIDAKIGANLGTNIEYSLKFIPGKLSDGIFKDNPFGFAIDLGMILAADKQSNCCLIRQPVCSCAMYTAKNPRIPYLMRIFSSFGKKKPCK